MDKKITIFLKTSESKYEECVNPIIQEARNRGYEVGIKYKNEISEYDANIGIFTFNPQSQLRNIDISIVIEHGIDDLYEPNYWYGSGWKKFDLGILPGDATAKNWQSQSWCANANPDLGVFKIGWPKSDPIFSGSFNNEAEKYKKELGIDNGRTVLYAPMYEHGKVNDFYKCVNELADNLLIKYADHDSGSYLPENESFDSLISQYDGMKNIHVLDRKKSVYYGLKISDVLVSDETSVIHEAALTDTIPVSVVDWPIKGEPSTSEMKTKLPDFAVRTNSDNLNNTVNACLQNYNYLLNEITKKREHDYKNLGYSSAVFIDIIDSLRNGEDITQVSIKPIDNRPWKEKLPVIIAIKTNQYHSNLIKLAQNYLPRSLERLLKRINLHKVSEKIIKKVRSNLIP